MYILAHIVRLESAPASSGQTQPHREGNRIWKILSCFPLDGTLRVWTALRMSTRCYRLLCVGKRRAKAAGSTATPKLAGEMQP